MNGGIAPRILNSIARWRWVVSFTHRPLYPCTPWKVGWMGSGASLDAMAMRKDPSLALTSNWTTVVQPVPCDWTTPMYSAIIDVQSKTMIVPLVLRNAGVGKSCPMKILTPIRIIPIAHPFYQFVQSHTWKYCDCKNSRDFHRNANSVITSRRLLEGESCLCA